ncbi:MAG: hypothetical protein ACJ762_18465 [Solirubrobacteraceae bacterium]
MKALYRTVSALLALVAGLLMALVVTAVTDGRDVEIVGYVLYVGGALIAAGTAAVLWSKTLKRR